MAAVESEETKRVYQGEPVTSVSTTVPDEEELAEGAAGAIRAAIADLRARGIATTHLVDGRLFRVYPDGRREDLGVLPRP